MTGLSWYQTGIEMVPLNAKSKKKIKKALFQEGPLKKEDIQKYNNKHNDILSYAAVDNKTKGVFILPWRNSHISILVQGRDGDSSTAHIKTVVSPHILASSFFSPSSRLTFKRYQILRRCLG